MKIQLPSKIYDSNYMALGLFATAMGILEAIVVVYLRYLYYPSGFHFPLRTIPANIVLIEWIREICTILMLLSAGFIFGRNARSRWAGFLMSFALWDMMYYAGLKIFLNWPPSLATWDLLFLIPIPWVGPVWAPLLVSFGMIVAGMTLMQSPRFPVPLQLKLSLIAGLVIMLWILMKDYFILISKNKLWSDYLNLASNSEFQKISESYIPRNFPALIFLLGFTAALVPFIYSLIVHRNEIAKNGEQS